MDTCLLTYIDFVQTFTIPKISFPSLPVSSALLYCLNLRSLAKFVAVLNRELVNFQTISLSEY